MGAWDLQSGGQGRAVVSILSWRRLLEALSRSRLVRSIGGQPGFVTGRWDAGLLGSDSAVSPGLWRRTRVEL